DAHQSLLATRMRTFDLLAIAPGYAARHADFFSLEMWGGATFDTAYRFLKESPWDRLAKLREKIPNVLFQMLLRAASAVGYTNYPDNVVKEFVKESADAGIDLFRIFDALNYLPNLRLAIDAVRGAGAHFLAIKDMAGLCKPYAAKKLIRALRQEVSLPIHFHTHDTTGGQMATLLMAAAEGVDVVDAAFAPLSGVTSQPNLNALVEALRFTDRDTGLEFGPLQETADYWEGVRQSS